MIESINMWTGQKRKVVKEIAKEVGFTKVMPRGSGELYSVHRNTLYHQTIDGLRLRFHSPSSYMDDIAGIITQIDFDDLTGRFPQHPEAIASLRLLYGRLPDLEYIKDAKEWVSLYSEKKLSPLLEYFASLK